MKITTILRNEAGDAPEGGSGGKKMTFGSYLKDAASQSRGELEQQQQDAGSAEAETRQSSDDAVNRLLRGVSQGGEPRQQKQESQQQDEDPFAELDEDLRKKLPERPGKEKGTGAQFDYVKAQRDIALEAWRRATTNAKTAAERAEAAKQLESRLAELDERVKMIPTLEEQLKAANSRLSQMDLAHDPDFNERFTQPIAKLERTIDEVLDLAGEEKPEVLSRLASAISSPKTADFMRMAAEAIEMLPSAMHPTILSDLRQVRELYKARAEALADHEKTKPMIEQERERKVRAKVDEFMQRQLPAIDQSVRENMKGIVEIFESDAMKGALAPYDADLRQIEHTYSSAVNALAKNAAGNVPQSAVQLMRLGVEATKAMVALSAVKNENDALRKKIEDLQKAADVDRSRRQSLRGTPASSSQEMQGSRPASMAEAYRQQYGNSD